jgi:dCTP deaminase
MILSNVEILKAIERRHFSITPLAGTDPTKAPFNTSAVDLRLGSQLNVFRENIPAAFDLRKSGLAKFLHDNSDKFTISEEQPYPLKKGKLVLGQTIEKVSFPLLDNTTCYSARVEGKSSLARCGVIVHFTAPTIHAGFTGPITLEIMNLGPIDFMLYPGMFFCQLIVEEVFGRPAEAPNQFSGQVNPSGTK